MTFEKVKMTQFKITLMASVILISGITIFTIQEIPEAEAATEPLLGSIMWSGFNFAPRGFADCAGQILPINQNQSLFSLFGTAYGGDGRTSFALPDMRGRTPVHEGPGFPLGARGGVESVVLNANQMASHTHSFDVNVNADDNANSNEPAGEYIAKFRRGYHDTTGATTTDTLGGVVVSSSGGSAHNNMQPYLVIQCSVAVQGLFPSRS